MGMLTISQILAIIGLLTAFGVDPITTADVQRILEGRPVITSTSTTTTMTPTRPPAPAPAAKPTPAPTGPTTAAAAAPAPTSKARIDIISPYPGKGLGRQHSTSTEFDQGGNPKNEVVIGAVVYDDHGEPTRVAAVAVHVKSPTGEEASTIQGTGDVTPIYVDGQKRVVPVYSFHYEFKTAGEHIITFSANGVSQSVTVQVGE